MSKNTSLASALVTCGEHCKSRIGRIEIVRNAKLERVYFAIPAACRYTHEGGGEVGRWGGEEMGGLIQHEPVRLFNIFHHQKKTPYVSG